MRMWPYTVPALIAFVVACGSAMDAATARVPELSEYRIITTRNIFDPDRNRPVPVREPREESPPPAPPPKPDFVDLTGILVQGDGGIAFLRSSRSEWNRTALLETGDTVGPGTLVSFSSAGITLRMGESEMVWPVGTRLVQNGESWALSQERSPVPAENAGAAEKTALARDDSGGTASDTSDILKKLMERRTKESQK